MQNDHGGGRSTLWLEPDSAPTQAYHTAPPATVPQAPQPPWRPEPQPEPRLVPLDDPRAAALLAGCVGLVTGVVLTAAVFLFVLDRSDDQATDTTGATDTTITDFTPSDDALPPDPLAAPGPSQPDPLTAQTGDGTASTQPGSSTSSTAQPSTSTSRSTTPTTAPTTAAPPSTTAPTTASTASTSTTAPTTASTTASSTTVAPTSPTTAPTTASTAAPTTPAPAPGPGGDDSAVQQQILALTNAERAEAGCPALTLHPSLTAAADGHSEDMAANDYFSHTDRNGEGPGARAQAAGYDYRGVGENIAAGYRNAESVMNGWMNSSGHRANILNCSYVHLGVGFARNPATDNAPYWTQVFGFGG